MIVQRFRKWVLPLILVQALAGCGPGATAPCHAGPPVHTPNNVYAGHFSGAFKESSAHSDELTFDLHIDDEGNITGKVTEVATKHSGSVSGKAYDETDGCIPPRAAMEVSFTLDPSQLRSVDGVRLEGNGLEGTLSSTYVVVSNKNGGPGSFNKGELTLSKLKP